jgi:hypothetical protein
MDLSQMQIRDDLKGEILTSSGGGEGAAAAFQRAAKIVRPPKIIGRAGENPPLAPRITDPPGENFSFTKVFETSPVICKVVERIAKVHPQIDPRLDGLATLRQMRESSERPLEARDRFPVG